MATPTATASTTDARPAAAIPVCRDRTSVVGSGPCPTGLRPAGPSVRRPSPSTRAAEGSSKAGAPASRRMKPQARRRMRPHGSRRMRPHRRMWQHGIRQVRRHGRRAPTGAPAPGRRRERPARVRRRRPRRGWGRGAGTRRGRRWPRRRGPCRRARGLPWPHAPGRPAAQDHRHEIGQRPPAAAAPRIRRQRRRGFVHSRAGGIPVVGGAHAHGQPEQ